jgi:hypothetical protein
MQWEAGFGGVKQAQVIPPAVDKARRIIIPIRNLFTISPHFHILKNKNCSYLTVKD